MSLLLGAACEKTQSELFKPQLVVHGLVMAKGIGVITNINRTYAIDEPFDTIFPDVSGMVWRGTDTWPLVHNVRDNYNTRQILPSPAYGDTFGIRVASNGFDTVYGRTVVPDSFRILFPRDGDTVTRNDSMVWTRSRNCAGYDMSITVVADVDTSFFDLAIPNDTTAGNLDSTVFRLPQMFFLYQFEQGIHVLRLYAVDTNYFDWVSAGGFGGGGDTTRLVGGRGVFGSAVVESLTVYVRTDTSGPGGDGRRQKSDVRIQKSEVTDTDGGTRRTAHGVRLARQVEPNVPSSVRGVVALRSPFLPYGEPLRNRRQ